MQTLFYILYMTLWNTEKSNFTLLKLCENIPENCRNKNSEKSGGGAVIKM